MPVIDPSSFSISVRIRTPEAVFPLWMGGGISGGHNFFRSGLSQAGLVSNPFDDYSDIPIVQSVEIELNPGLSGKLSVEIGAPYDLGLALMESELFTLGNTIEVQIGYPRVGLFLPWFAAMQVRPQITLDPDNGLSATLEGQGGTFAASRGSAPTQFTNISYADIITMLALRSYNNWEVELPSEMRAEESLAPNPFGLASPFVGSSDPLFIERESISQGNRSDWMFVNYMARQAGCEALPMPSPTTPGRTLVRILRRADGIMGTPSVTLVARSQIDMLNRFPILSFESGMEGVWLPRQRVRTADVDPDTRREESRTVDQQAREEDGGVPRLGEASVGEGAGQVGETTVAALASEGDGQFVTAPVTDPSRTPEEVANMEVDEAGFRGGINATITTIGLPTVFPGQTIRVEGMGVFTGNYMIMGMTHQANDSEWTTTFNVMTNAEFDGEHISTLIQQRWPSFNDQQPQQQTDVEGGGTEEVEPGADLSAAEQQELGGGG